MAVVRIAAKGKKVLLCAWLRRGCLLTALAFSLAFFLSVNVVAQVPPPPTYKKKDHAKTTARTITPPSTANPIETKNNRRVKAPKNQKRKSAGIVQVFERKHKLYYRFASPPAAVFEIETDLNLPHSLYQFNVSTVETVRRNNRESVIAFDFDSDLLLTARQVPNSKATNGAAGGANFFDLHLYPYRFTAWETKDDRGTRVWQFDPVFGFTRTQRDGQVENFSLDDKFVERQSLRSAAIEPMVLPLRNGALVGKVTDSAFLEELRLSWVGEALVSMLPPLPTIELAVGRKWQAGIPLQAAGPAEATIVRCAVEFRSYDPETGMAEVGWKYTSGNQRLAPTPGIHHIGTSSVAAVEASGIVFLHAPTGWVRSADTIVKASITNSEKPNVTVDFVRTMHLHCLKTPARIRDWSKNYGLTAPVGNNEE